MKHRIPVSAPQGGSSSCACSERRAAPSWHRREFLKIVTAGAGFLTFSPWQAVAGPFTRNDFEQLVPRDKKLTPEWVAALTARGEPTVYRGADLEKIGMPVGGLCAGQIYLGGDGQLWHWDIFNQQTRTGAEHYAKPLAPASPLEQGFAIRVVSGDKVIERRLDRNQWREVSFNGEYPIGCVDYADPECPVRIRLEAFSPFIPLNTADSSLPTTILEFTVRNHGPEEASVELAAWLENAVCLHSGLTRDGLRRNRLVRSGELLALECSAVEAPAVQRESRPDVVFEDFEKERYNQWTATGNAFGQGPVASNQVPEYQGDLGGKGRRVLNSHASAPGNNVGEKDAATGTLTSRPFTIERDYINFLIGGGAHRGKTCLNLLVENKVTLSATGRNDNHMQPVSWDVRRWVGKAAVLQVVDAESGGWGNIGLDEIVFSDRPREPLGPLAQETDFGTLVLALLDPRPADTGWTSVAIEEIPGTIFSEANSRSEPAAQNFHGRLAGALTRRLNLAPGAEGKAVFLLAWHFPHLKMARLPGGRFYAKRFNSALDVARYVTREFARLSSQTRLWHDTWYDSTLPYWFLDRTFLNTSILASSTCHRFADGRFYGWEGVGCCPGTCGHVWQYAHAVARLFPELERSTREKVDFGLGLQPDGAIHFRGEFNNIPAVDGQAGTILRALREHQASPDDAFLKRNWPQIRKATEWMISRDGNDDGLIESGQHNTLDTDWFGPVAWLSGLYLAALLAAETMATEAGDTAFAATCRRIFDAGRAKLVAELFDTESGYFVNRPDPKHADTINSGTGCHIDQVFGQSWAFQVGLPRVLPERETRSALAALWRYNFTPDVGPYREVYKPGRWYAMPGEAGLLMCTFPRSDWDYAQARGKGAEWAAGYFNECMNGFEYQVASHMLWEGMLTEGLAITRAIHDRYHPSRRNPWNEVECGDHYARSMASYGVFLAACGYEYHGPKGRLSFAPRLRPADFKAAFTAASGWGTYEQKFVERQGWCALGLKWGTLRLKFLAVELPAGVKVSGVLATCAGREQNVAHTLQGNHLLLEFAPELALSVGDKLELTLGFQRGA